MDRATILATRARHYEAELYNGLARAVSAIPALTVLELQRLLARADQVLETFTRLREETRRPVKRQDASKILRRGVDRQIERFLS